MPILSVLCLAMSCTSFGSRADGVKLSVQVPGSEKAQTAFLPRRGKMLVHCKVLGGNPSWGTCRVTVYREWGRDMNTGRRFLSDYVNHATVTGSEFDLNMRDLIDRADKKDFVARELNMTGHIRLYLGLSRESTGEQLATTPVEIGEPTPPSLPTLLQVSERRRAGGGQTWKEDAPFDLDTEFRWSTSARAAKRIVVQLSQMMFRGWEGWASSQYTTMDLNDRSRGLADYRRFTARELLKSPPPPGYEVGAFYLRVVPIDSEGNLAGLPSNVVKLLREPQVSGRFRATRRLPMD